MERVLLGCLKLRHLRGGIDYLVDVDRGSDPVEDNRFRRIINEDVPRVCFLGHQFENAVVRYGAVVQECVAWALSVSFFHNREDQAGKSKHADAAGPGAAPNARDRRVDPEMAGFHHFASDERKVPASDVEQRRRRSPVAGKLSQRHAGVVGQAKRGAVHETDADSAVGRCLDDVALADRIARLDFNNDFTSACKGARADDYLDFADKRTRSDSRLRSEASRTISLARRSAEPSEHCPCPTL